MTTLITAAKETMDALVSVLLVQAPHVQGHFEI